MYAITECVNVHGDDDIDKILNHSISRYVKFYKHTQTQTQTQICAYTDTCTHHVLF